VSKFQTDGIESQHNRPHPPPSERRGDTIGDQAEMEEAGSAGQTRRLGRRLLLFSLPFQGHINPMFQLATLLFQRGFSVTVIHTLFNAPDPSGHPHFRFVAIDDGLPEEVLNSHDILAKAIAITEACRAPFRDCLVRLLEEAAREGEDPVACLLADAMLYSIAGVAEELGVRRVAVRTSSAAYMRMFSVFPTLWGKGYYPIQKQRREEEVPEAPPYRVKDLMNFEHSSDASLLEIITNGMESIRDSAALVLNTFEDLEAADVAVLRRALPSPVFTVGPLHKFSQNASNSLLEQDRSCMAWLDRHPAGSVIYVSFGSLADMEKEELAEVAWGLAGSGQPFLWVVRLGSVRGEGAVELPAGFAEETQGRGMVVAWAPQVEVLAHPAVGAFWTHCGWNSIVESLCEGVPMLCRPCFGDQTGNARYVSHVWKVGLVLEDALQRGQVERAVRTLLVEEEGAELRERARSMKEKAGSCIKEGGSSYGCLDNLVDFILSAP
ncbi:hypothetical protein Taro_049455, partial [Colocasia esculenta]|nr:hypothetical protein [Colocasia esculenta]